MLVGYIFNNIGDDLITHLAFSKLRLDIWDHGYKGRGQEFWESILRASGLSVTTDDNTGFCEGQLDMWEELAPECGEHALTSQHPKYGMARLREDEQLMRTSGMTMNALTVREVVDQVNLDRINPHLVLTSSTLWSGIAFKRRKRKQQEPETWDSAVYLRVDSQSGMLEFGDVLEDHPLIWSFATFPPLSRIHIPAVPTQGPCNFSGVTVGDLLQWIMLQDENKTSANSYPSVTENGARYPASNKACPSQELAGR